MMRYSLSRSRFPPGLVFPAALVVGLTIAGCQIFTGPKDPDRELAEARAIWEGLKIRSYTIDQARSCECLPPYHYMLVVEDGVIADVVYDRHPEWTAIHDGFLTVDEVFDLLEHARRDQPAQWRANYDAAYGYPTDIFVDPHKDGIDDEISIEMSGLVVTG